MSRWFRRARQPRGRRRIRRRAIAGCFWSSCIRARARRGCLTRPSGRGLVLRRGLPPPPGGHLRQHDDGCADALHRHGARPQPALSREVLAPSGAPVACTPGAGWKKGQGENPVGHARGRLFVPGRAARRTPRSPPGLVKRAAPRPRREPGIPDVGAVTRHGFRKSSPMGGGGNGYLQTAAAASI